MRLGLPVMAEATPIKSLQYGPKQELSKDDTNGNAKEDGGHEASTLHQELQELRKARNELGKARGGPAQGRTHHLFLQFEAISLGNTHTGDYI